MDELLGGEEPRDLLTLLLWKHGNRASRELAESLVAEFQERGFNLCDLVYHLLTLFDQGPHRAPVRFKSEGSGHVRDIRIVSEEELLLTRQDGSEYRLMMDARGPAWRTHLGLIGRTRLEYELGVWPGYADAIEDAFRAIRRFARGLVEEAEQGRRELETLHRDLNDELRQRLSLDRHPLLRLWRDRSPATAAPPACLASVRNVKRLEVLQPCVVYFLIREEQVVYVGQTFAPWPARILQHLRDGDKTFHDVWYLEVDRQSLDIVEQAMIARFEPEYNRAGRNNVLLQDTGGENVLEGDLS